MIPREHLPLALVTFAVVAMLFLMYREISAVKTAVAQLSVPSPGENTALEADATDDDDDADESVVDLISEHLGDFIDKAKNARHKNHHATARNGDAMRASRAVRAEDHDIRPEATDTENALHRTTKASVNTSSKDSASKLKK